MELREETIYRGNGNRVREGKLGGVSWKTASHGTLTSKRALEKSENGGGPSNESRRYSLYDGEWDQEFKIPQERWSSRQVKEPGKPCSRECLSRA